MKLLNRKLRTKLFTVLPILVSAALLPSGLNAEVLEKGEDGKWQTVEQNHSKSLANLAENSQVTASKKPLKLIADEIKQELSIAEQNISSHNIPTKTKFKQSVVLHNIDQFDIAQTVELPQEIEIIGLNANLEQTQNFASKGNKSGKDKRIAVKKSRKKVRSIKNNIKHATQKRVANKIARSNRRASTDIFSGNFSKPLNLSANAALRRSAVQPIIIAAARQYNVDINLIDAIMWQESRYRDNAQSHVGAIGLMQLMPATARELGVNPYDNWQNVFGGVAYLRRQLNRFGGNVSLALAAYNAGPGAVRRYRGVPPYKETRNYVRSILSRYNKRQLQIVNNLLNSRIVVNPFSNSSRNSLNSRSLLSSFNFDFNFIEDGNKIYDQKNQRSPKRKEKDNYIKFAMNRSEQINNLPILPYRKI